MSYSGFGVSAGLLQSFQDVTGEKLGLSDTYVQGSFLGEGAKWSPNLAKGLL